MLLEEFRFAHQSRVSNQNLAQVYDPYTHFLDKQGVSDLKRKKKSFCTWSFRTYFVSCSRIRWWTITPCKDCFLYFQLTFTLFHSKGISMKIERFKVGGKGLSCTERWPQPHWTPLSWTGTLTTLITSARYSSSNISAWLH